MLFRYLQARWRYRGGRAGAFLRAGLALDDRAYRLADFWQEHLSRSRAAEARWMRDCPRGLLTVLGAGALRDFHAAAATQRFDRLRLVDANPLAAECWQGIGVPLEAVITDISHSFEVWASQLRDFKGSWPETLRLLEELKPQAAYSKPTDALLSLNILSQLEVGWQEAVEPLLKRRFGGTFVRKREQDWLQSIRPSSRVLAEQHLAALSASKADSILLISDVEYVDYRGRHYRARQVEPPPARWTDKGWRADEGVVLEVTAALEGVNLAPETFTRWLPDYRLVWHESWLWHISPQGVESDEKGTLHRVAAFSLRLNR